MNTRIFFSSRAIFSLALVLLIAGCDEYSGGTDILKAQREANESVDASWQFPTGELKALSFTVEVKNGPTIDSSSMDHFEGSAKIARTGKNRIKIETRVKMRVFSGGRTKEDRRTDFYKVEWSDAKEGRLVNVNRNLPGAQFYIEDETIRFRGWIPRNNSWESQVYELPK